MPSFGKILVEWYERQHRALPWRETRDPYRIWISEVMLQQTRVAAVLPYYERFLARFPDAASLANASDEELLTAWSGLGYYSRARNLRKAAQIIAGNGRFPNDYDLLRALPGIGDYTAAAVASIAFGFPRAALDGNVLRVLSRIRNDAGDIGASAVRRRFQDEAQQLLDQKRPGAFNQAMMELGATICLPRDPRCLLCPVARFCAARKAGREKELPVKARRVETRRIEKTLLLIERDGKLLLRQRGPDARKLSGFWELPEPEDAPGCVVGENLGSFRHSIVNHDYRIEVRRASLLSPPPELTWIPWPRLGGIPLSTSAKKALGVAEKRNR